MFNIFYTDQARKYLKKLDESDRVRIISVIERCRLRPHAHVKKLVSSPYFRLRAGKYRIILDIKDGRLIILVLDIGHRKKIYKS